LHLSAFILSLSVSVVFLNFCSAGGAEKGFSMIYSERVRQAISFAGQEAVRLGHDHIGTGHLLLGIIRQGDGVAIEILKAMYVDLEKLKAELEKMLEERGRGPVIGNVQLSIRAKNVLKLAEEESSRMEHKYVGTEHLLIGLIIEQEGVASKAMAGFDIEINKARALAQTYDNDEEEHTETITFHNANIMSSSEKYYELSSPVVGKHIQDQEILNLDEASQFLRISVEEFRTLLKSNDVPARIIGGEWRFSRSAIIKWLGEGSSKAYVENE